MAIQQSYTPVGPVSPEKIGTPGFVSAFRESPSGGLPDLGYVPRGQGKPTDSPIVPNFVSRIPQRPTFEQSELDRKNTFQTEEEQIRARKAAEATAIVNSINASFAPLFDEQRQANVNQEARTRAVNISSGLAGSDFAGAAATETEKRGQKALRLLEEEKGAKIAEVLTRSASKTDEDIAARRKAFNEETDSALARRKTYTESANAFLPGPETIVL